MSHFERLVLSLVIIFASLSVGYLVQCLQKAAIWRISDAGFQNSRKTLQKFAIFFLMPGSAMLSLWGLPAPGPGLLVLPFVGTLSYIIGGWLALKAGRLQGMTRSQLGSYYGCGAFTNLGAVGGLVCLILLGENTIALVALYRLLEEIYFFGIAYPIASSYADKAEAITFSLRRFKPHPGIAIIIAALSLGILLNLTGVSRPDALSPLASAMMIAGTVFLLVSIGMNLHLSATFRYIKPALVICVIKFLCMPVLITGLAFCLGAAALEGGLAIKTICVLSSMPVAMYALVPPSLFDLDIDLANTCWIISTLGLFLVIPMLIFILPHI